MRTPAGTCDCHLHIYGPPGAFPAASPTPAGAGLEDYRCLQRQLGLERAVIVQPVAYGFDNRCTLESTAALGEAGRCIVIPDPSADGATLAALHEGGARGVRFHMLPDGPLGWDALAPLAARIAPLGWHVQLQMRGAGLPEAEARLAALPVPVVIDHIGRFEGGTSQSAPPFRTLLRLLESGQGWVKLSAPYWSSTAGAPFPDVAPLVRRLAEVAPERLLFATNWPHPSLAPDRRADDRALMELLLGWLPDEASRRRVLVENPARLYGFA
jgi:D-galactarolactone isomerase